MLAYGIISFISLRKEQRKYLRKEIDKNYKKTTSTFFLLKDFF
jgi:hypothetical protein